MAYTFEVNEEVDGIHLGEDAKAAKEATDPSQSNRIQASFMGKEGSYTFRIWPDRGENNRLLLIRRDWIHNYAFENGKVLCTSDSRIDKLKEDATKQGWKEAWKLGTQENHIMMVHMFHIEGEAASDDKYHKEDSDYALLMHPWQAFKVHEFFESLTPKERMDLINPSNAAPAIKLKQFSQESNPKYKSVTISLTHENYEMGEMKLNEGVEWEGLNNIYIKKDTPCPDDVYSKLQKHVAGKIGSIGSFNDPTQMSEEERGAQTPGDSKSNNSVQTQSSQPATEVVNKSDFNGPQAVESDDDNISRSLHDARCKHPEAGKGVDFGKPPSPCAECIRCEVQIDCYKKANLVKEENIQ